MDLGAKIRETIKLRTFGLLNIPILFFISPSVQELTEERAVVKVPLTRRSRNHLKSMYFGAMAAGADCVGGLLAMKVIEASRTKVNLVFKDFKADFLKRAEGDVLFICDEGAAIGALIQKALASGERENLPVNVIATVPSKFQNEPVAKFVLTLSVKKGKA